jgi:hypothetical protein
MDASNFALIAVGCGKNAFSLSQLGKKGTHPHPHPSPFTPSTSHPNSHLHPSFLLFPSLSYSHLFIPFFSRAHVRSHLTNKKKEVYEMDALADELLQPAPLDYDSDTVINEIQAGEYVVARDCNLGLWTYTEIFKNALEN